MFDQWRSAHYRFELVALQAARLPAYKGGMLRGGFGYLFKQGVCAYPQPLEQDCGRCPRRDACPYPYVFETQAGDAGQQALDLTDAPRPFVIEPPLDFKTQYAPGERVIFGLVLIGRAIDYLPYFLAVFDQLGRTGLGAERARFRLDSATMVHPVTGDEALLFSPGQPLRPARLEANWSDVLALAARQPTDRLRLRFLTPTRLKHGGELTDRPALHVVFRNALRRAVAEYSEHCASYDWNNGAGDLVRQAEQAQATRYDLRWADWGRTSGRQQRDIKLGGVIGEADFVGDLRELMPILALGTLIHVGKAATFGHGRLALNPNGGDH